jgi:Cu-Zn family superoxide dismutase
MKAIVVFDPRSNNGIQGTVTFTQLNPTANVRVIIRLQGFDKSSNSNPHAIHIHEYGDISNGCMSTGGHFNPTNNTHGTRMIKNMPRHAGDLCNNIYPVNGNVYFNFIDDAITLFGINSIIGRTVVIHEGEDDLGLGGLNNNGEIINVKLHNESLKTGNAGGRIACAIIGIAR